MNLLVRTIKAGLLLAQVLLLGVCVWVALEARRTASIKPRPVLVDIEKGWGVRTIADTLKKEGVLTKKTPFIVRYRLFYRRAALKAGQYEMPAPSTPQSVLEALNRGQVYLRPVTVAEGLTGAGNLSALPGSRIRRRGGLHQGRRGHVRDGAPGPAGRRPRRISFSRDIPAAQGDHGPAKFSPA